MTRSRLLPLALAVLLPLTACGGDEPDAAARTTSSGGSALETSPGPSAAPSAAGPDRPAAASASPSATAPGPSDPGPSAPAAASAPRAASSGPAPRTAAAPAAGEAAIAAGDYTYDAKGTVTVGSPQPVDGQAVLTVDPAAAGQQHTVLESEQGRTEQDVVLREDGRYLASLDLTNPAFSKQFRPDPAVLLLPSPATVGRSWSWRATSTDGKTTASTTNRVLREEAVTVGGERVECVVVETRLVLSGDVDYRGTTTTWVSDRYGLPVKDRSQGEGTVSGVAFTTDITTTLRSTRPA